MSKTKRLLLIFWYLLLALEFTIWIATAIGFGWAGLISIVAFVTIIPLLLAVEGLELAVASLLGSSVSLSPAAARELAQIKANPALPFFPNRQLAVVSSIVLLTMASGFDQIYVPSVGWVSDYNLPTIFNIIFPTQTVLLFAQVPGKMLALYAPGRFFEQTWWICVGVRWVGSLEMTSPAEPLTQSLAVILGYPVQHTSPAPETRLVYPVYDYIDGEWYYVVPEDGATNA